METCNPTEAVRMVNGDGSTSSRKGKKGQGSQLVARGKENTRGHSDIGQQSRGGG